MTIYIFDVDGVITNPVLKKVEEKQILEIIAEKIKTDLVAFNTGRSISWMIERILTPLDNFLSDQTALENLFVVAEKGGTWINFDNTGNRKFFKDEKISVPLMLQQEVKRVIENSYAESMFYDDTKETMISTEMKDGYPIEKFKVLQKKLAKTLEELLVDYHLEKDFAVDANSIATDIGSVATGKNFAVRRIINWIKNKQIIPDKYIIFGDSFSDIPGAEELYKNNFPMEFVFVGSKETLQNINFPFKVSFIGGYDKGTLEYLTKYT